MPQSLVEKLYDSEKRAYVHALGPKTDRRWFAIPEDDSLVEELNETYGYLQANVIVKLLVGILGFLLCLLIGVILAIATQQWVYLLIIALMWCVVPAIKKIGRIDSETYSNSKFARPLWTTAEIVIALGIYLVDGWSFTWFFLFVIPVIFSIVFYKSGAIAAAKKMSQASKDFNKKVLSHPEWEITQEVLAKRVAKKTL